MKLFEMTTVPFESLNKSTTLVEATKLFKKYQLDGLPVINEAQKLQGIFTKANLCDSISGGML